jgi:hypothetical protein
MATTTYEPIYSTTLSSNQSTVSFSSFGGYTDLRIVANIKLTGTNGVYFKPNSDSSSVYSATTMYGNGSSTTSSRLTTGDLGGTGMYIPGGTFSTSNFSVLQIDFMNYTNTNVYKTALARYSTPGSRVGCSAELFAKTTAITTLEFGCDGGGSIASGSTFTLYGISNADIGAKATGGVITYDDTYFYHTFGVSGTFTPTQALTADILVVGGGGGGANNQYGNSGGGGGGAGGLLGFASQSLTATGYTVTVGAGGSAGTTGAASGTGSDSQFGALTLVKGGGRGAGWAGGFYGSTNGGSGGGGAGFGALQAGIGGGGSATSGQGYAGGSSVYDYPTYSTYSSAGGGGAGAVGQSASSATVGGNGGVGLSTYSSWGLVTGTGQNSAGTVYYAGGGGAGGYSGVSFGTGGLGGGGTGANVGTSVASSGLANTGGGGGGGGNNTPGAAGAGGSGVVIVRYEK